MHSSEVLLLLSAFLQILLILAYTIRTKTKEKGIGTA